MSEATVAEGIRRYGIGTYIGAGHLAVQRLENGYTEHPLGASMIRAAVDWRRAGLDGMPASTLTCLAPAYVDTAGHHPIEDPTAALMWATARIDGTIQLLEHVAGGSESETYRAFDYIVDHLTDTASPIPDATWNAVEAATGLTHALTVAISASDNNRPELAARILTSIVAQSPSDNPDTLNARHFLAYLRQQEGHVTQAIRDLSAVLSDANRILGTDHPDTLLIRASLRSPLICEPQVV